MRQYMLALVMGELLAMLTGASHDGLDFEALVSEQGSASQLPALQRFEARDGTPLAYRHYPSESPAALIVLHGSGADSKYLATFAQGLADAGAAAVISTISISLRMILLILFITSKRKTQQYPA